MTGDGPSDPVGNDEVGTTSESAEGPAATDDTGAVLGVEAEPDDGAGPGEQLSDGAQPTDAADGPTVDEAPPADPVAQAVLGWRDALVRTAGGSTLADVGLLGDASLDLTTAHPSGTAQLFAGRQTRLSNLVREDAALASARRRARAVAARAGTYAQQYGIAPTYLAIGVATWTERAEQPRASAAGSGDGTGEDAARQAAGGEQATEERTVRAPVLLRPVTLHARGTAEADYEIALEPSVEVNPVLVRALRLRGALLDADEAARSTFRGASFDPREALARIGSLGQAVLEDFDLGDRVLVGTFVHPGQVLVDDLDRMAPGLGQHEVLAALAGDEEARRAVQTPLPEPVVGDRDPQTERGAGDLDPAQVHVLDVVATGAHVFVDAPADADTTGTVAALVADAAAAGRTVLYVPGHRRAADALKERLDALGLGDLLLDVAPEAGWRSEAGRRLLGAMTLEVDPVDPTATDLARATLVDRRERLRGYLAGLHEAREPWHVSAFDAFQALAALTGARPTPSTTARLPVVVAEALTEERRRQLSEVLVAAAQVGAFSLRPVDTPWFGADLPTPQAADAALAAVDRLVGEQGLAALVRRAAEVAEITGFAQAGTVQEWGEQLTVLADVRQVLDVFQPLVFERSVADLVSATGSKQWRAEHGVTMGFWLRRRLRKQAKDLLRPGRHVPDLHASLAEAQQQREVWQSRSQTGGWPQLPGDLVAMEDEYRAVRGDLDALEPVLARTPEGGDLVTASLPHVQDRLGRLAEGRDAVPAMPERTRLLQELSAAGLDPLLYDLADRHVTQWLVGPELELAWWSTVFEQIITADPALAGYDGQALSHLVEEYRGLDLAQIGSLAAPVRARATAWTRQAMIEHRDQTEALFGDIVEDRFAGLRASWERYPDVARRLRPVVAAAPMLVPQVLPAARGVDLVVLDAVGHLPLEVTVSTLARGRQVVVLGDPRCASGSAVRDLHELLPSVPLRADSSRRDPYLTAFLAGHGYQHVLSATPLPTSTTAVGYHLVDGTGMPDDSGTVPSSRAEVDRVVELVVEHAYSRPEESLAVVTAAPAHSAQVREAVLAQVRDNPVLAATLDPGRHEPFVVTDLTSTAGLRRDTLVLSLGFGRTPHGRVLHRFGPVSEPGGDALLLAALGVTRHRLEVVTSLAAEDLDPDRLRGPGALLLVDLLRFAESRAQGEIELPLAVADPQSAIPVADPLPLEQQDEVVESGTEDDLAVAVVGDREPDRLVVDLAERLWRHGLVVELDHGLPGGLRLPMAVGHPDLPGELVVAVLTDDDAYLREPSVRVRDRQVPERLERLGWSVIRVWSVAAFIDPEAEVDRIRRAVHTVADQRIEAVQAGRRLTVPGEPDPAWSGDLSEPEPGTAAQAAVARIGVPTGAGLPAGGGAGDLRPTAPPVATTARPGADPVTGQVSVVDDGAAAGQGTGAVPAVAADIPGVMAAAEPMTGAVPVVDPDGDDAGARPRPDVRPGLPINTYSDDQLDDLTAWVLSDGQPRTDSRLAAELRLELGITRRGSRVDAVIASAVQRARRRG